MDAAANVVRNTIVSASSAPPYVKIAGNVPPPLDVTILLHKLCPDQEYAFRLIMHNLSLHIAGEPNVPQLKLAILGNAGARDFTRAYSLQAVESHGMGAILWFLFQHNATCDVRVTGTLWVVLCWNRYHRMAR
jgi:hypothetical protein